MSNNLFLAGGTVKFTETAIEYGGIGEFRVGERNVVYGKNGSGKSTLLRCLSGIIPGVYRAGVNLEGSLDGVPLFKQKTHPIAKLFSVLPQNLQEYFLGFSVEEELDFACSSENPTREEIIKRIFNTCEIAPLLDRQIWELSDGERKRIAVACLFARKRKWYFLDEWRLHLDDKWKLKLESLLTDFSREQVFGTLELQTERPDKTINQRPLESRVLFSGDIVFKGFQTRSIALDQLLKGYHSKTGRGGAYVLYHDGVLKQGRFKKNITPIEIAGGEIVAVFGENGSGKTTLLKGMKISNKHWPPSKPSFVLTNPSLQLACKDICELIRRVIRREKVCEANSAMNLVCQAVNISRSLDPLELSAGQKKLLAIILAVLNKKGGLLIDDVYEGLDNESQDLANQAILFAAKELNKCVIVTSPSAKNVDDLNCGVINI